MVPSLLSAQEEPTNSPPPAGEVVSHRRLMIALDRERPRRPIERRDLRLELGEIDFVDPRQIRPGQFRYSIENVNRHLQDMAEENQLEWDHTRRRWERHRKALLSLDEAVPVIRTDRGYLLLDGHHHVMAALYLRSRKFPVHVVEDLTGRSQNYQARRIRELQLTNYRGLDGNWHRISWFSRMQDDPLLMVVRRLRFRIVMKSDGHIRGSGSSFPVWIAFKGDPYAELKIADALHAAGFRLPQNFSGEVSPEMEEQIRRHLVRMADERPELLRGIEIVRERQGIADIDLAEIYRGHLGRVRNHPCIPFYRDKRIR